ncbi:MAG: sodium:proton antiporter [Ignavibacteria bacterium]|nr:sodium:proton antiporter [Ignavibacteriota bacterium]
MTTAIIVTLCILILISYAFDLSSKHTKIPSVILLLALGWGVHQLITFFEITGVPDLDPLLPILGTVGLILIVLEGSLELELNKSKKNVLIKSALSAFLPIIILFLIIGYAFHYMSDANLKDCFINAIPFCIISSAVAIPSVRSLSKLNKEFVIYETSMSDIFGVIIFNFFTVNEIINITAGGHFLLQLVSILLISFGASIGLALLIKNIDHHVKFIPIIMIVILIYTVSKIYHLPSLIFILIFGLWLNNLEELKNFSFIKKLAPEKLETEVQRFREVVVEIAFLVRTMFFLLFGFLIDATTLLDPNGLLIAIGIIVVVYLIRFIQLKITKMDVSPLLYIAPRGLITILLFISIPANRQLSFVNESLIIQVILISAIIMMGGIMLNKKNLQNEQA